jgi:exodeoxyribonuclease V gamma subunit
MPLSVHYVSSLREVVEPAASFLRRDRDLFAVPRIVVANAGMRAWLSAELAGRLGASGVDDGVLAAVDVCYPGALARLLEPAALRDDDPWAVDRLTFAVLEVIVARADRADLVARFGGPLRAARAFAERFDVYHVRRSEMIRAWAEGRATLSPTAEHPHDPALLPPTALVQFQVWRSVQEALAVPPPLCRTLVPHAGVGDVFVAGLERLSCRQIQWLESLADHGHVEIVLVHPSAALHRHWATTPPAATPGLVPERREQPRDPGVDPLVATWLRGARETQWLLASQGIETQPPAMPPPAGHTLLDRLKRTVTHDLLPTPEPFDPHDVSVRIHRCHGLGRQAEVLFDAILHACRKLPDLHPHEIAIVSPCIAEAAPHLEAVFARRLNVSGQIVHLPLVVADRDVRQLSPGAELLGDLLALVRSRYSVEAVLAVAAHPLVLARFGLDDDGMAVWERCLERTRVRWGLDAAQRKAAGLDAPGLRAHTWRLGLEQMLLGAALPDDTPREELGGVVPLDDLEPAQLDAIAALVTIVGIVSDLDAATDTERAVGAWCDLLEEVLTRLCGAESPDLVEPLRELENLRRAANDVVVPFHDVKVLLGDALDAASGRQPLRTGAITATSMVPLRGVPFRVVCVIGYDDRAVSPGEARSDDLVVAQDLLGDVDPRLEVRRGLLDCLLAASDRVVVTCTGMDVATNKTLPLATPLAELVDFARRHGVPAHPHKGSDHAAIEVFHPRHAVSPGNFTPGTLHPTAAWSHDPTAGATAAALRRPVTDRATAAARPAALTTVELAQLEELLHDPLAPFVRRTLDIDTWRDDEAHPPATLPLGLAAWEERRLTADLLDVVVAGPHDDAAVAEWGAAMQAGGRLPFGAFGTAKRDEIATVARGLAAAAVEAGLPIAAGRTHDIRLAVGRFQVVGHVAGVHQAAGRMLLVRPEALDSRRFQKPRLTAGLWLLAAIADGLDVREAFVVGRHEKWSPGGAGPVTMGRTIVADPGIDAAEARRRLERLCHLLELATAAPRGGFGDTAAAVVTEPSGDAGPKAFAAFVNDDYRYPSSLERVVYGPRPEFGRVFFTGSPELVFHEALAGLVEVRSAGDMEYALR